MKFNKNKIIITLLLFFLTIVTTIFLLLDNESLKKKNYDSSEKIKFLEESINKCKNIEEQNCDILETENNFKCNYIETYKFIDYYNYKGATPDSIFLILDQFQIFSPIIMEINKNDFNQELIKNTYYEIEFESAMINGIESQKKRIISIKETDKEGLEQIQETCKKKI